MVAALILLLSVLALTQFAVSQWRLLWLTTAHQPLSDTLRAATGLDVETIRATDFASLLDMCDRVCPEIRNKTPWLREVTWYYRLLGKVEMLSQAALPAAGAWVAKEMRICARFVAVVLDQNLALDLDRRAAASSV